MNQLHILLVEDDEDDFVLTRDLLRETEGFLPVVDWLDNYQSALAAMTQNEYDVYLLDYRLGAKDGLSLLREANAQGCRGPIILLTGQGDHDIDLEAMRAGAADYLIKSEITAPLLERSIRYSIEQKRSEAELAELKQRLAESQEVERLHLAQELHDGPLQDLIGIRFHIGVITNVMGKPQIETQLQNVQKNLQTVIHSLRALCRELRPPALAPFGLEQAIRAHAKNFQESHPHIAIALDLDEDRQTLPERVRLALYRIYQHALANIAIHADASNVRVIFRLDEEQVYLRIIDDGRGFQLPARWIEFAREGHFGLAGAAERAEAIGGLLDVVTAPDMGTSLSVSAPR
ncbi:MAG TPA: response regulator [Caldilineaceae bacterium]|nr:response regulator [Caldilineaceae bacterium]